MHGACWTYRGSSAASRCVLVFAVSFRTPTFRTGSSGFRTLDPNRVGTREAVHEHGSGTGLADKKLGTRSKRRLLGLGTSVRAPAPTLLGAHKRGVWGRLQIRCPWPGAGNYQPMETLHLDNCEIVSANARTTQANPNNIPTPRCAEIHHLIIIRCLTRLTSCTEETSSCFPFLFTRDVDSPPDLLGD